MNDVNKFSNLQTAMGNMSALQNLVIGMPSTQNTLNISPEVVKQMQWAQKFASSPAYQAMVKQQKIWSEMAIPASLMAEMQAANNLIQPALQNINFDNLTKIVQSENFFKSALAVKNASINFLEEMKKLDNYQQKTLAEILKEIRLKKNGEFDLAEIESAEVELPEDFSLEVQESFTRFINSIVNLHKKHKKIFFMLDTITTFGSNGQYEVIDIISYFVWFCLLVNLLRGEKILAGNSNLKDSFKNKQDEFYTDISLVENELKHYREHFRDKIIFCNCDDPYESEFFKYFAVRFNSFGLKKLIATNYCGSPVAGKEFSLFDEVEEISAKKAFKVEITEVKDWNGDGYPDLLDVQHIIKTGKNNLMELKGDENFSAGDFRSEECKKILQQADIVVTNPPFSLFREYLQQLVDFDKKFLIVGNMNNITYQKIFPLFMENKIWLGYNSGHFWFKVPEYYEEKKTDFKIDSDGQKWRRMGNICWFTNLDIAKRHEDLMLGKKYYKNPELFPKYDNYDAIEVSKTAEIPQDYFEVMGVPLTFMDKHNPEQFEILGVSSGRDEFLASPTKKYKNSVQHNLNGTISNGSKVNTGAALLFEEKPNDIYYTADNVEGYLKTVYTRIFIRRK